MTKNKTVTREEWLKVRLELLRAEKELTRRSDEVARQRQELPWVRIDKESSANQALTQSVYFAKYGPDCYDTANFAKYVSLDPARCRLLVSLRFGAPVVSWLTASACKYLLC